MGRDVALVVGGWVLLGLARALSTLRPALARRWSSDESRDRTRDILVALGFGAAGISGINVVLGLTADEPAWLRLGWLTVGFGLVSLVTVIMLGGPGVLLNRFRRRRSDAGSVAHPVPSKSRIPREGSAF